MSDQTKYTQKLKGAKVLVIGGSSGIGFGIAEALVEHGAVVTISSSKTARVEAAVERLKNDYPSASARISGYACNLGDYNVLESNIQSLFDRVGTLDHVIYTAGDPLLTMEVKDVDMPAILQAGTVRFFGPLLVAKHASQHLTGGPRSSITLTTGVVSERPMSGWAVVNSFATGLQGMARGLALDLKPIRVNLVSPGPIDTELLGTLVISDEAKGAMFKQMEAKLPTGRIGRVQDVAEAYLYLLKDENCTGTMVGSNGGTLLVG